MMIKDVSQEEIIFSLDIGTRSVIGTVGIVKEKKFHVLCESYIEHEERAMIDGQIHNVSLVAKAVEHVKAELEEKLGFKLNHVAIAAAGRFLKTTLVKSMMDIDINKEIDKETIRSIELTAVKRAEDQVNRQAQGKLYCVGYSVKNYYLNGYVINNLLSHKGENIAAEVIATFLPRSVVDSLYAVMEKVSLEVTALTLEPIAAMEAIIPQNLRLLNLALVDIGAGTSDIAISSKDSISAYGMVPLAGDEVTEAIAQNLLIDFNCAEKIKRNILILDKIKYVDVLGFENEISREDLLAIIKPTTEKISEEIANKIIELNGGKSPSALFLVGGGAHTPNLMETITQKLKLTSQRVVIKGRESISDCICEDYSLGSIGVTVIGIALVCIKRLGHDFIEVTLNDNVVSLFNSHKHNVLDVMLQAGINPKILIGNNGQNIEFFFNGVKRTAFGSLSTNPKIIIKGKETNVDATIKEGDKIEIEFAKDGKKAVPKAIDYVKEIYSVSFYLNGELKNLDPICFINEEKRALEALIKEGDQVVIVNPKTLGDFKNYYDFEDDKYSYYIENTRLSDKYVIKEGVKIKRLSLEDIPEKEVEQKVTISEAEAPIDVAVKTTSTREFFTRFSEEKMEEASVKAQESVNSSNININVNGEIINLLGKDKYVFVDIFNYIKFDLTSTKGRLVLKLNEGNANYYDHLKQGDIIKIYWEG
ncbi:MAG TPA: cell division protein FtsA [Clostridiaceae bacterium]